MEREHFLQKIETQFQVQPVCAILGPSDQSGSDLDLSREPPLTSSRSEPFQSPIKSQPTDRWQLGFKLTS